MNKTVKIILIVMILALTLAAGCTKSAPEEGIEAPDFQLKSLNGPTISLSDLQDHPVLLNFWTTWCTYCRAEMPFFQQLAEDPYWEAQGLVIVAVNIQESEETVREFITANSLSFNVLLDTAAEVAMLYNVAAIPVSYIIDKNGIIKYVKTGNFTNKEEIDKVLSDMLIKE